MYKRQEVDGVVLRCGVTHWGTANECVADECFERHYAGFAAQKVPMGAYYYSAADCDAKVDVYKRQRHRHARPAAEGRRCL